MAKPTSATQGAGTSAAQDSGTSTPPLISVEKLEKRFDLGGRLLGRRKQVYAVNDVSFEVHKGETYGLVGESGCGKSTTGRLVQRLLEPSGGVIRYEGAEIAHADRSRLRSYATQVQTVFQDPYASLNPRFRIQTSLLEVLRIHGIGTPADRHQLVADALSEVGFHPDVGSRFPHEFSGGQRQRIGIARAILVSPALLICDEPVSALDVSVQSQILNMLKELQRNRGITYLFISHDLSVVKYVAHRVGVMYLGRLVEEADTPSLYARPLHPYTRALLGSVPIDHPAKRTPRAQLTGDVPSQTEQTKGCVFRTRCPIAAAICNEVTPEFREVSPGHKVACHMADADSANPGPTDPQPVSHHPSESKDNS